MKKNEKNEQQAQGTTSAQKQNQDSIEKDRQHGVLDSSKKSPTAAGDRREGDANAKLSADRGEKKDSGQLKGFNYQHKNRYAEKDTAVAEGKKRGSKKNEQKNDDEEYVPTKREHKFIRSF